MAALTLTAETTVVNIIGRMTISAGNWSCQLFTFGWVLMAIITGDVFVPTIELEFGFLVMVKIPNFPVTLIVTNFTLLTQT